MNSVEKENVLHCLKSMIDEAVCEECTLYGTTGTDHCEKDCVRLAINALEQDTKKVEFGDVYELIATQEAIIEKQDRIIQLQQEQINILKKDAPLEKIRAEIIELSYQRLFENVSNNSLLSSVIEIIDKYRPKK